MRLREHISAAKAKAVRDAAINGLKAERSKIGSLDGLLNDAHIVEGLITDAKNGRLLILPISSRQPTSLEKLLAAAVLNSLQEYEPEQKEYYGFVAYKLPKGGRIKLQGVEAGGLRFNLSLIRESLGIDKRAPELPMVGDFYQPTASQGTKVDIEWKPENLTPVKYNLIPVYGKNVRSIFPGYKMPFELQWNDKSIVTHVASGRASSSVGSLNGRYIAKGIRELYTDCPEISKLGKITIEVVEPGKVYRVVELEQQRS